MFLYESYTVDYIRKKTYRDFASDQMCFTYVCVSSLTDIPGGQLLVRGAPMLPMSTNVVCAAGIRLGRGEKRLRRDIMHK